MKQRTISIRGLDTILFRDGRPFDATPGSVATGLTVPYPSTLAGFVRTQAGRAAGDFSKARDIEFAGPLLCRNGQPLFASPADIVPFKGESQLELVSLRPFDPPEGAGCDMPAGLLPLRVTEDMKPEPGYNWWSAETMFKWLLDEKPDISILHRNIGPELDERVHIEIEKGESVGSAKSGALFSTAMVAFERIQDRVAVEFSYLCRISEPTEVSTPLGPGLLGGEQRIGLIEEAKADWPECPAELAAKLKQATHVRLVLATPAIFECGWLPQWLDRSTKTGSPPAVESVRLKLVSAVIPRRLALSGWDMEHARPKPVRWLVPAGSVYFFEVVEGDAASLAATGWLTSVSDLEQTRGGKEFKSNNRNDGFGLAMWGLWQREE